MGEYPLVFEEMLLRHRHLLERMCRELQRRPGMLKPLDDLVYSAVCARAALLRAQSPKLSADDVEALRSYVRCDDEDNGGVFGYGNADPASWNRLVEYGYLEAAPYDPHRCRPFPGALYDAGVLR